MIFPSIVLSVEKFKSARRSAIMEEIGTKMAIGRFWEELNFYADVQVGSLELESLHLNRLPLLKSLPHQIQHFTSLTQKYAQAHRTLISLMRVFKGFFRSWNSLCLNGGRVCAVEDVNFYRIGNKNARGELLLAVGTKLDHVISQMSRADAEKYTMPTNLDLIIHPSAEYPSFHRPRLVILIQQLPTNQRTCGVSRLVAL